MRSIATFLALAIAIAPVATLAQRHGGGGGGFQRGGGGGAARGGASSSGRGFNLGNDVPSSRQGGNRSGNVSGGNRYGNGNGNHTQGNANSGNRYNNTNANRNYNNTNANRNYNNTNANRNYNNTNVNRNYNNTNVNRNYNNTYNRNVNVNNVNVNGRYSYSYNRTGYNGYGWHGAVVVNPVYRGPAWGWNRGVVWAPNYGYWGGGFWGAFAVGATTAAVMGSIYYNNQRYYSYQVSTGSPGAQLLSNYGLQQVPCGPPGLVVIYGPNNAMICANPNSRVAPGTYAVNQNNLTLQSQ